MKIQVEMTVNDRTLRLETAVNRTLVEILRQDLLLTGTKEGCGQGDCGSCIVLVDGRPINACLVLAPDLEGAEVTTIEGLAREGILHPLQQAFIDHGAVQCGFCTPGMILSAKALLDVNPFPGRAEIQEGLSGVLCRCGSYPKIIEAVEAAAAVLAEEDGPTKGGGHED